MSTGDAVDVVRVLIVDDQAMVRAGLRMIVDNEDDLVVVGEAADGEAGVQMSRALAPDVVLMDIRMPRLDGIAATRAIAGGSAQQAASPDQGDQGPARPAVLVLTTFDDEENLLDALRAGAAGFLLKDAGPDVMVSGIRSVFRGDSLVDPAMTHVLVTRYLDLDAQRQPAPASPRSRWGDRIETLSPRERDVLRGLAGGSSNRQLAQQMGVTEATVKCHVSNVLAKLGARSRLEAVVAAYETGLVAPGETPAEPAAGDLPAPVAEGRIRQRS